MKKYTILRVYRDDNALYPESEYLAVVDNRDCYLVDLISYDYPEWTNAVIRFLQPVWTSDPGLLNNTTSALAGWHFLLDTEHIREVQAWEVVANHQPADVVIEQHAADDPGKGTDNRDERFELAERVLTFIKPIPSLGNYVPRHFPAYLANRFTTAQLREGLVHLQAGKTVEFRYREYSQI